MARKTHPYIWPVTLIIALVVGYFVLKPFLGVTVFGLLIAFIFYPLYKWLGTKIKSDGVNVMLTTLASLLIIAIPLTFVLYLTVHEAVDLAHNLANSQLFVNGADVTSSVDDLTKNVNGKIESLVGVHDALKADSVNSFIHTTLPQIARSMGNLILGVVGGIPNFFTMLIVYLFVFTAGLTYGKNLRSIATDISPFDKATNEKYVGRLGAMAKAMLKGQFLIAILQGVASAAVLALVGFSDYFWVMAVLFTFLSFIPLGAGIITIPLGIILILLGNVWGGIAVLANHFVIITNIDNVVRPKVVPKNAQLPAVLTILGAFGGVSLFGLIGVVYGPMLMIFVTTTIESYIHYKKTAA